ncbi:MAG: sensor histidine kinase [Burkholderiaceae bacterium]
MTRLHRQFPAALSLAPASEPLARPLKQALLGLLWSGSITTFATQFDGWISLEGALVLYLMGTALAGYSVGVYASLTSSVGSVAGLNYFFIPPQHTLLVDSPQSWIALLGLFLVSFIVSALTLRLQVERTKAENERERSTLARELLELLVGMDSREEILSAGCSRISSILKTTVRVVSVAHGESVPEDLDPDVFRWCVRHGRPAGPFTDQGLLLDYWCIPIESEAQVSSVLKVSAIATPIGTNQEAQIERLALLRMLGQQLSLALQREHAAIGQQRALTEKAQEEQRSVVLASIAHDLRTPLSTILMGITTLKGSLQSHPSPAHLRMIASIEAEAIRAARMTDHVLTWVKLTTLGESTLRAGWQALEEVIGETASRMDPLRKECGALLQIFLEPGLPLVWGDAELLSKLLENLLGNAMRHADAENPLIEVRAAQSQGGVQCLVMDNGKGFGATVPPISGGEGPPRDEQGPKGGTGLGISIVRSIAQLHRGRVDFGRRPDGLTGACVSVWLPTRP